MVMHQGPEHLAEHEGKTVTIGVDTEPSAKQPRRPFVTRRTLTVFFVLLVMLLIYYGYVTYRLLDFSAAAQNVSPSYCPSYLWANVLSSSAMFSIVYLNPTASFTQYALKAAQFCSQAANLTGPGYTSTIGIVGSSTTTSSVTTTAQPFGGVVGT